MLKTTLLSSATTAAAHLVAQAVEGALVQAVQMLCVLQDRVVEQTLRAQHNSRVSISKAWDHLTVRASVAQAPVSAAS